LKTGLQNSYGFPVYSNKKETLFSKRVSPKQLMSVWIFSQTNLKYSTSCEGTSEYFHSLYQNKLI